MASSRSGVKAGGLATVLASCLFCVSCSHPAAEDCEFHKGRDGAAIRFYAYDSIGSLRIVDSMAADEEAHVLPLASGGRVMAAASACGLAYFIVEGCILTFDAKDCQVIGGELNAMRRDFELTLSRLRGAAELRYDSVAHCEHLSEDDRNAELAGVVTQETERMRDYAMRVVTANADNAVGQYAFWFGIAQNAGITNDEYDKLLGRAGSRVACFPPTAEETWRRKHERETAVGCNIADAGLLDMCGDSVRLTQLVQGGRLTILHIFDPYNDTTPRTLAMLHRLRGQSAKYGGVGIVSVAERSGCGIARRITDKFNLGWPVVADPSCSLRREYGVASLPYFVIVEDGKIAERGIKENALTRWVLASLEE